MGPKSFAVRSGGVTHTAVLLINLLQREPHGESFTRFDHPVVTILMWRCRRADFGRLVKKLHVARCRFAPDQQFGQAGEIAVIHHAVKKRIVLVQSNELPDGVRTILGLIINIGVGQPGNGISDVAVQILEQFLEAVRIQKSGQTDIPIAIVIGFDSGSLGFVENHDE